MVSSRYRNVFCAFCNGEDLYVNLGMTSCELFDITRLFTLLVSVDMPEIPDTTPDHKTYCDGGMELDPVSVSIPENINHANVRFTSVCHTLCGENCFITPYFELKLA